MLMLGLCMLIGLFVGVTPVCVDDGTVCVDDGTVCVDVAPVSA